MTIRLEMPGDLDGIISVTNSAFETHLESEVIKKLRADEDDVLSMVKLKDDTIIGHIQFYKVYIDGNHSAIGLGPVSVYPEYQNKGIGSDLIKTALERVKALPNAQFVFLLGHINYYPRFGFCPDLAAKFDNPFQRPAFMALRLDETAPASGKVTLPKAFG